MNEVTPTLLKQQQTRTHRSQHVHGTLIQNYLITVTLDVGYYLLKTQTFL